MLTIFQNPQFGEIRTAMSESNEPLFCAVDVCRALEYAKPNNAIHTHVDPEDTLKQGTPTSGGYQEMVYLTESGLYSLIFGSKLESAKRFKKWVTSEVLPSLRKTGEYRITSHPKQIECSEMQTQMMFIDMYSKCMNLNDASKHILYSQVAGRVNLELPSYVPSKGVLRSVSECLKKVESQMSPKQFNKLLVSAGYMAVNTRPSSSGKEKKFNTITEKGLAFGENQVYPNCPKETHPLWYEDRFHELYNELTSA